MTIDITNVSRREQYSGSAGAGPYPFDFEVLAQTDIAAYKNSTLLTLTTDYTVTINGDGTGSITLVTPATAQDLITIIGARPIERTTDFVTGGDLTAASLNDELDSLVIFDQQLLETQARTMRFAPSADIVGVSLELPSPVAGKAIKWNATADALELSSTDPDEQASTAAASAVTATTQAGIATTQAGIATSEAQSAEAARLAAEAAQTAAEAAAATIPTYPSLTGQTGKYVRVAASETAVEFRSTAQVLSDIGGQAQLVSGTNIKTINGTSVLGSGDVTIQSGGGTAGNIFMATNFGGF